MDLSLAVFFGGAESPWTRAPTGHFPAGEGAVGEDGLKPAQEICDVFGGSAAVLGRQDPVGGEQLESARSHVHELGLSAGR